MSKRVLSCSTRLDRPIEVTRVLETFPEVLGVLRELRRRGVRMAVVSDGVAEPA